MTRKLVVLDYGSGNLHSAAKAFERAAREAGTEARIVVTSDPETVAAADRVVLPGVGHMLQYVAADTVVAEIEALAARERVGAE